VEMQDRFGKNERRNIDGIFIYFLVEHMEGKK
jgi:hypothetical protein